MKTISTTLVRLLSFATVALGGSLIVSAQTYTPLAPLPGTYTGTIDAPTTDITTYLSGMFKLLIALGGGVAILTAIIGGTQYVAAGINPSLKEDAKGRIQNSLIGLALVLSSYLILNTIDPKLVDIKFLLPPVGGAGAGGQAPGVTTQPGGPSVPGGTATTTPGNIPATVDSAIEALNLSATAKAAAYTLKTQFPTVKFTSGTRNMNDQARAMAQNVAQNRQFIVQTYRASSARTKLQNWVDTNPTKTSVADIQAGLLSTMQQMTPDELLNVSKHLSGNAFDVQPVSGSQGTQIKQAIRALPGLILFLEQEAGLTRWHAQF